MHNQTLAQEALNLDAQIQHLGEEIAKLKGDIADREDRIQRMHCLLEKFMASVENEVWK